MLLLAVATVHEPTLTVAIHAVGAAGYARTPLTLEVKNAVGNALVYPIRFHISHGFTTEGSS